MASQSEQHHTSEFRFIVQYAVLTVAIFLPLLVAFVRVTNTYPVAVWNMMQAGGELQRSRTYFILRGETVGGNTVDIRGAKLTNALYGRTWGLVAATANNDNFKLSTLHPDNEHLLLQVGGLDALPAGARMSDLLQAWGQIYNERQPADSPNRLRAIRLDMYRWESGDYNRFDKFIESWRKEL
ncbi:MAG: hypothetical protein C5B55_03355 [Blastocatellia bacterium]|nr:MAG: hypothetical protein C5B55_03355 [Blastocatellia bacterium]